VYGRWMIDREARSGPNRKIGWVKRLGSDGLISELAFNLFDKSRPYFKRAPAQNRPKFGKINFSR
jgi:hypothetical protein